MIQFHVYIHIEFPRPKLFSRNPHLSIPNIRSINHEKPRISRQKATIAHVSGKEKAERCRFGRHVTQSQRRIQFPRAPCHPGWTRFFNLGKCFQSQKDDNIGIFTALFNIDLSNVVMRVPQTLTLSTAECPATCLWTVLNPLFVGIFT